MSSANNIRVLVNVQLVFVGFLRGFGSLIIKHNKELIIPWSLVQVQVGPPTKTKCYNQKGGQACKFSKLRQPTTILYPAEAEQFLTLDDHTLPFYVGGMR